MCRVPRPARASDTTGVSGAGEIWVTLLGQGDTRGRLRSPWEISGYIPSKAPSPRPDSLLRTPPGSPQGTAGPRPVHSQPWQGPSARPAPPQLLPVTPLGKLGTAPAADTLQTPLFVVFLLNSQPEATIPCASPTRLCPLALPQVREIPRGHQPLGKSREGAGRILETQKYFPISRFGTPSIKTRRICELTPKRSCFEEENASICKPLLCSWGGNTTPSTGTVGASSCPRCGHPIRPYPRDSSWLGHFGGHRAEGDHRAPGAWNGR